MTKFLLLLVLAVAGAGVMFLATWDMPPPTTTIEKVIPNDRFR